MAKSIGIDLGTTNSCVAVLEGGEPMVITNSEGERTTPSVVAFDRRSGERLVGQLARRQAVTNPERTIYSIKRFMGRRYSDVKTEAERVGYVVKSGPGGDIRIQVDEKDYSPPEISAMILQKLKRDAEEYLGEEVTDAVITVPAYFEDAQRQQPPRRRRLRRQGSRVDGRRVQEGRGHRPLQGQDGGPAPRRGGREGQEGALLHDEHLHQPALHHRRPERPEAHGPDAHPGAVQHPDGGPRRGHRGSRAARDAGRRAAAWPGRPGDTRWRLDPHPRGAGPGQGDNRQGAPQGHQPGRGRRRGGRDPGRRSRRRGQGRAAPRRHAA